MAATDYELQLYQRLKAILLAHAPLTALVRPGNFVWYDGNRDDPELAQSGAPADYPKLALEPSGMTQELWEARQRYGDHVVSAAAANLVRNVVVTFNFTVRITHRNLRLTLNTPVEAEAVRALRGSNPTMSVPGGAGGFNWVRGWGPLAVSRQMGVVEGDATSASRMMSVIPLPVYTLFNSADLLT